jgi:hypothetical protein
MYMKLLPIIGSYTLLLIALLPQPAHALLPPDLVFSAGVQIIQFFSLFALVIGGMLSGGVMFFRTTLLLSKQNCWLIVSVLLTVVFVAISFVYVIESAKQYQVYQRHIEQLEGRAVAPSTTEDAVASGKVFVSTLFTLYGESQGEPFVMEFSSSRQQKTPHEFVQYSSIKGSIFGNSFGDYVSVYKPTYDINPAGFIKSFSHILAEDLSVRDSYTATVEVDGEELSIRVDGIEGDFISRSNPAYTRYQSTADAEVTYRGETFKTQVLVENLYSDDYSKYIFFDDYEEVESITQQLILWDSADNFYMIDQTEVFSDTPEYPSHTWVLHKNGVTGTTQKAFDASVSMDKSIFADPTWTVSVPAFSDATIELSVASLYVDTKARKHYLVEGVVSDDMGRRTISGIVYLAE